ncbi:MAG: HIT domain-containing protein [Alphaproteobacteria bacterium]|nr:HIT domain-containing protein [Alphaproteobacteria bacterium]
MSFILHPRLEADTVPVKNLGLSRLLMMNDQTWPWLILVPERADVREIHQLVPADRLVLIEEIAYVGEILERLFKPAKINVAALGNMVAQLHVHVIARFENDPAWPKPVWGACPPAPFAPQALLDRLRALHEVFDR